MNSSKQTLEDIRQQRGAVLQEHEQQFDQYLDDYTVGFTGSQRLLGEIPYNMLHRRMLVRVLCGGRCDGGDDITMVDIDKITEVSSNIDRVWQDFIRDLYFEHRFQLVGL
jgi:hypothetical protein